jgi:hypothetical protein
MLPGIPIANCCRTGRCWCFRGRRHAGKGRVLVINTVPQSRDTDLPAVALARTGVSRVFPNSESVSVGYRADLTLGIFANSDIETAAVARTKLAPTCGARQYGSERCTPLRDARPPTSLFLLTDLADDEELEDRRGVTRSKACRMPTDGSRQGMTAGREMVGRGHVASLRGCDPSCCPTSSRARSPRSRQNRSAASAVEDFFPACRAGRHPHALPG